MSKSEERNDDDYSWEAIEKWIQERMNPKRRPLLSSTLLERLRQGADNLRNIPEREM